MSKLFTIFQVISSLSSPFLFVHFFSQHYYNIPLWKIITWWYQSHSTVTDSEFYFIGLFFILLFMFLSFSGFINIILLSIFGKKQKLVYLGHDKQSNAVYYDIDDASKKAVSSHDFDIKHNMSFDNLYRAQLFIKDPGNTDRVGTKANRFHIFGYITVILGVVVFSLSGAAFFNAFIYPVYLDAPTNVGVSLDGAEIAFINIIAHYNISESWYYGSLFSLLFVWIGFLLAVPKNLLSDKLLSLPPYIRGGEIIKGTPKQIKIRYIKQRRSGNSDSYEEIDSGERYIIFEFIKGFTQPVYVSTLVDVQTHKNKIKEIYFNIKSLKSMSVTLEDDLSISIPTDKHT